MRGGVRHDRLSGLQSFFSRRFAERGPKPEAVLAIQRSRFNPAQFRENLPAELLAPRLFEQVEIKKRDSGDLALPAFLALKGPPYALASLVKNFSGFSVCGLVSLHRVKYGT